MSFAYKPEHFTGGFLRISCEKIQVPAEYCLYHKSDDRTDDHHYNKNSAD